MRISRGDEARAWDFFKRYRDKSFSSTDCMSFTVGERLRVDCAIALDEAFRSFGLNELAMAAKADAIVTRNVRDVAHGELNFPMLRVLAPAQCLEVFP